MENLHLIEKAANLLKEHETTASYTNPMRKFLAGARIALESVILLFRGNTKALDYLMAPQLLDKLPTNLKEVLPMLQAMRESGTVNPYLRFRLVDKNDRTNSWYPVEFDGEYRLWGYTSTKEEAHLGIFYVQQLPLDLEIDTEFEPKFLQELLG